MNNNQSTYNQPPMGEMIPPPQAPMSMRQRMSRGVRRVQDVFPKWLSQYPIVIYILALVVVSFMYSSYSLPWYYMLSGMAAVLVFFLLGSTFATRNSVDNIRKERRFEHRIFLIAFIPRVLWMILIYNLFMQNYGDYFGFENADALFYDDMGKEFAVAFKEGKFLQKWISEQAYLDISDMGYMTYLGFIYWLTGTADIASMQSIGGHIDTSVMSIITVRLIKCILSSITVVLVYRLSKRNFSTPTARVAAIFCALWPNFWYYCGTHLKETEMVFLGVLFVEQADQMLRSRQFTAWKIIPVMLIGAALFTLRTPLALVAFLSLIFSVVMSSSKVVNWGKRIIVGALAIALIGVTMGNRIQEQARMLTEQAQSGYQKGNMEWRAEREHGNAFAKYAGASVFAPMIFTLPFPTMVRPFDGQNVQQLLNGGNFTKNIISGFTIFALITLLISGKWREHLLPLSFLLGYLVVLAVSAFAQSERFHQPAMPFEFMFAAYGLSIAVTKKKYKRWFTYWCALMFIAAIAWNWFKMTGRGLV